MMKKFLAGLVAGLMMFGMCGIAYSMTITENGDAGDLLSTAQIAYGTGVIERITGELTGNADIDMYGIYIDDPDAFAVTVTSSLSGDNDAMLWLFDSNGSLVHSADDGGIGYIPQFNAGDLSGYAAGNYFLAYNLFYSEPIGDPLYDWLSVPFEEQVGSYTLALSGVSGVSDGSGSSDPTAPVPEPSTIFLFSIGLAVIMGSRIRRKK